MADGQATAITLERYAEVAAHLTYFRTAAASEIAERLGLDPAEVDAAQRHWTRAIGDELVRRETTLTTQMAEVFGPVLRRLEETKPALASIGPRASERAPKPSAEDLLPAGMRRFASVAMTQEAAHAPSKPAIPFARGAPAPATPPRSAPAPEALLPEGMRRFVAVTGTHDASSAPAGAALPFPQRPAPPAGAPADPPPLPLEQYARLHVELALAPASQPQVLQRHGLDERRLAALDAHWGPRIKADAGLRAIWDSTYSAHRARVAGPQR